MSSRPYKRDHFVAHKQDRVQQAGCPCLMDDLCVTTVRQKQHTFFRKAYLTNRGANIGWQAQTLDSTEEEGRVALDLAREVVEADVVRCAEEVAEIVADALLEDARDLGEGEHRDEVRVQVRQLVPQVHVRLARLGHCDEVNGPLEHKDKQVPAGRDALDRVLLALEERHHGLDDAHERRQLGLVAVLCVDGLAAGRQDEKVLFVLDPRRVGRILVAVLALTAAAATAVCCCCRRVELAFGDLLRLFEAG